MSSNTENIPHPPMNRVVIVGSCGSGKTTLGGRLADKMGAVAIDLDELHWEPNWQSAPDAVFVARVEKAIEAPRWVISGNYSRVQEKFIGKADTIIWLDYPFVLVLWRLTRRTWRRVVWKERCCNGNSESWKLIFSRDSIFLWLFRTFKRRRVLCQNIFSNYPTVRQLHFTRSQQTEIWLQNVSDSSAK